MDTAKNIIKSFMIHLAKRHPVLYFALMNLYFGFLCWSLGSLISPNIFGKWNFTSMLGWLWGGAIIAFLFYVSNKKNTQ